MKTTDEIILNLAYLIGPLFSVLFCILFIGLSVYGLLDCFAIQETIENLNINF